MDLCCSRFFNDVALLLGLGEMLVYADNLKLYFLVHSMNDCRHLQRLLQIFHRKRNPLVFECDIDGVILLRVDTVRDLGVELD